MDMDDHGEGNSNVVTFWFHKVSVENVEAAFRL